MNALLWIQGKRKTLERIEFVSMLRLARSNQRNYEKTLEKWARDAEIRLTFED